MKPLTATQAKVLAYIKEHSRENGYPPTTWEISTHFGWASPNAARSHLKLIGRKGYIVLKGRTARGIFVL